VGFSYLSFYVIDVDLDLVSDLGSGDENHKSLNSSDAIALLGDVLYLDVVLFSSLDRCFSGVGVIITGKQKLHLP